MHRCWPSLINKTNSYHTHTLLHARLRVTKSSQGEDLDCSSHVLPSWFASSVTAAQSICSSAGTCEGLHGAQGDAFDAVIQTFHLLGGLFFNTNYCEWERTHMGQGGFTPEGKAWPTPGHRRCVEPLRPGKHTEGPWSNRQPQGRLQPQNNPQQVSF